jgi:hypothetical protein
MSGGAGQTVSRFIHGGHMTLKNAALLALVGMVLATLVLVAGFVGDVLGVVRGLHAPVKMLTSFIYAFAGLGMVVFLLAFHQARS